MTMYMEKVDGRYATDAWNMPQLVPIKRTVSTPMRVPKRFTNKCNYT